MFILFVSFIEYKYKYYKMNIRYISVFKFCYNVICLRCLLCFGADKEIISNLLVHIFFCILKHAALVKAIKVQLFVLSTEHQTAER